MTAAPAGTFTVVCFGEVVSGLAHEAVRVLTVSGITTGIASSAAADALMAFVRGLSEKVGAAAENVRPEGFGCRTMGRTFGAFSGKGKISGPADSCVSASL